MSAVKVPEHVIDLSQYIDLSKYTFYDGEHARLSGKYHVYSSTNVSTIDDPGA